MIAPLHQRLNGFGFGLLLASVCSAEEVKPPGGSPFTVVTYNIRYDNPGDGPNGWAHRREAMVAYLREAKADLIGTQEVLPQQRDYLAEQLTDYAHYSVGRDDGVKGEATPIFYRKDRYELRGQRDVLAVGHARQARQQGLGRRPAARLFVAQAARQTGRKVAPGREYAF